MLTNDTLRIIKERRSIRSYKTEQISRQELQAVLEAGIFAPYAEENSRHFTVIQNKSLIDRLSSEAKAAAVQMGIPGLSELGLAKAFHCLYGAPSAVIVSGNENTVGFESDCAAATQNILIAAEALGLGSCWIYFTLLAFFSHTGENLKKELQIPGGFKPFASIALGYKNEKPVDPPTRKTDVITFIR